MGRNIFVGGGGGGVWGRIYSLGLVNTESSPER